MNKQVIGRMATIAAISILAGCASQNINRPAPGTEQGEPGHVYGTQPGAGMPPAQPGTGQPNASGSQSSNPTQSNGQPAPVKVPPKQASQISSPAVMSLLGSADTLAKAGHMDASAATLERALDIAPRNPFIYQRLAAVRLAQGQTGQAEQMAMKSNSLSNNNPFVEAGNWRMIAEARRSSGDSQGAGQASARAANFSDAASQYSQ